MQTEFNRSRVPETCAQPWWERECPAMKKINVRFERDKDLEGIEVVVRASEEDEEVRKLLRHLQGGKSPKSIRVFNGEGAVCALYEREIVLVSVRGKLVNVFTEEENWFTRRTLQSLEEELDPQRFVRISRYELVNLDKILHCDFSAAGTLRLKLAGGTETWASRRCIPVIQKRLMGKGGSR